VHVFKALVTLRIGIAAQKRHRKFCFPARARSVKGLQALQMQLSPAERLVLSAIQALFIHGNLLEILMLF